MEGPWLSWPLCEHGGLPVEPPDVVDGEPRRSVILRWTGLAAFAVLGALAILHATRVESLPAVLPVPLHGP